MAVFILNLIGSSHSQSSSKDWLKFVCDGRHCETNCHEVKKNVAREKNTTRKKNDQMTESQS